MGKNVFANGMEIAHQSGDAKVIAAFPDVCLSPPSPPAGPIPVPYPDTSFAKDLKQGSSTVKIGGKPLALKGQSYYQSSPLGDEAATRSFGGSVLSHTITGKTYFQAHSMDVLVEGKNVCRHLDVTTSNHASYPGSTPPIPNVEMQALAVELVEKDICPCCKGPKHATGADMHRDEWYKDNLQQEHDRRMADIAKEKADAAAALANAGSKSATKKASKLVATASRKEAGALQDFATKSGELDDLLARAMARPNCICPKPPPPVLPSPPCDVFYKRHPPGPERTEQKERLDDEFKTYRLAALPLDDKDRPEPMRGVQLGEKVNHLTPKSAGGCPTGKGNLQRSGALCDACKRIDTEFNDFQN
jgi:hypothetical protein